MRVLQINYIFPPKPEVGDGITAIVYNLSEELVKRGHKVSVYTSNAVNLTSYSKFAESEYTFPNHVQVCYSNFLWKFDTFFMTPSIVPLLKKTLSAFDVVHIHDARSFQGIAAGLIANRYGIPYVFQPHGSFLSLPPSSLKRRIARYWLDRTISKRLVTNSSKIIASSKFGAELYSRELSIPREKIAVIPNAIIIEATGRPSTRSGFRVRFNLPEEKKIVLYLGRIHKTKRIDLLIQAHAIIVKQMKCNNVILVIAGPDCGNLEYIKSLVDSYGLSEDVSFIGFISKEDKFQALLEAEVFVTPSFSGFPMTFLEACSAGVPIITTRLGDILGWIDGNVGFVTSPTPQKLAEAILTIITDEGLRKRFSRNGRAIVNSEFSIKSVVKRLEKIYEEVTVGR